MNALGLSSGSLPRAGADELLACLDELGLGVVDLRLGKGHGWEPTGLEPFEAAGVPVAFVGVSVTLGEGEPGLPQVVAALRSLLAGRRGMPVKVFASSALDTDGPHWELARQQVAALAAVAGGRVLVETHHGYAGLPALQRLCARHDCGVLLDIGGFYRLTGGFDDAGLVRRYAEAGQVKGFTATSPERHVGLEHLPPQAWVLLGQLPAHSPITIESRAGTLAQDAGLLRERLPEHIERSR